MQVPSFQDSLGAMQYFLCQEGHPSRFLWVFRDDLFFTSAEQVQVRYTGDRDNEQLAAKVFEEGRSKGLVEIVVIAKTSAESLATVWYPKRPEEEILGWSEGMKLSIRSPLPTARVVKGPLLWFLACLRPAYRRYQSNAQFIGTRTWASGAPLNARIV